MAATNLFNDLKSALNDFKTFLDANIAAIKPVVVAVKAILPQLGDLLTKLIDLLGKLKTEIQNLNVGAIPGLDKLSTFTAGVKTLLTTAESLLPQDKDSIDSVLGAVDVVGNLPSLDNVKGEILALLDNIIGQLNGLNA